MSSTRYAVPYLHELFETVADFGRASLELVAWELSLTETDLAPAFGYAVSRGLLVDPMPSPETGEQEYRLATNALRVAGVVDG